jgi:phosphoribosylanthranilate isomerase
LTPDNVGEAIRLTGASLVDVSSGVERAVGEKDARLVRSFIEAAKAAVPQRRAKAS